MTFGSYKQRAFAVEAFFLFSENYTWEKSKIWASHSNFGRHGNVPSWTKINSKLGKLIQYYGNNTKENWRKLKLSVNIEIVQTVCLRRSAKKQALALHFLQENLLYYVFVAFIYNDI